MCSTFEEAYPWIAKHEGGRDDDPDDRGGPTSFGVTQADVDACGLALVPDGTRAESLAPWQAKAIVRALYWDRPHVYLLRQRIATKVCDLGLLFGPERAVRWLQQAVSLIGNRIAVDGKIGPETARNAALCDEERLLDLLAEMATRRSREIVDRDASQAKFLKGWVSRANDQPPA